MARPRKTTQSRHPGHHRPEARSPRRRVLSIAPRRPWTPDLHRTAQQPALPGLLGFVYGVMDDLRLRRRWIWRELSGLPFELLDRLGHPWRSELLIHEPLCILRCPIGPEVELQQHHAIGGPLGGSPGGGRSELIQLLCPLSAHFPEGGIMPRKRSTRSMMLLTRELG